MWCMLQPEQPSLSLSLARSLYLVKALMPTAASSPIAERTVIYTTGREKEPKQVMRRREKHQAAVSTSTEKEVLSDYNHYIFQY